MSQRTTPFMKLSNLIARAWSPATPMGSGHLLRLSATSPQAEGSTIFGSVAGTVLDGASNVGGCPICKTR
jgi:hypothetical protein